jgi:hypothetical protein
VQQAARGIPKNCAWSYARAAGIATHFQELLYSHIVLFGCDERSEEIGLSLYENDEFMTGLRKFRDYHSAQKPYLYLQSYPVYGTRLQIVLHRMNSWRPQNLRQAVIKPYSDPLSYYAFWFAVGIGTVTILSLVATMMQTYVSYQAYRAQSKSADDG